MADEAVRIDARSTKRGGATGCLLLCREVVLRSGDVADPSMTELEQMLRRELAGVALVDADGRHGERIQSAVDEHDARTFLDEACVVSVVAAHVRHLARDEDHPV